jgi:hypothetical protein
VGLLARFIRVADVNFSTWSFPYSRKSNMPSPDPSTTFLSGVAIVCACLAGFAIFESKAGGKLDASKMSPDVTASIRSAKQPKRRPIEAATGWGEVSPQLEQTARVGR